MKLTITILCSLFLWGCASTSWQQGEAYRSATRSWKKQEECRELDQKHVIALYNLERMPDNAFLREEQARLKSESDFCRSQLNRLELEKREALLLWESSIVENQLELKSIRDAEKEADERDRKHGRRPPPSE